MTNEKRPRDPEQVRELVREGYTRVVQQRADSDAGQADAAARRIGYSEDQLEAVPEGANLGVGCGNPTAIDRLRPGETVVDLGSGAGMDAFLMPGNLTYGQFVALMHINMRCLQWCS